MSRDPSEPVPRVGAGPVVRRCLAEALDRFEPCARRPQGYRYRALSLVLAFAIFVATVGSAVWLGDQVSQSGSVMTRFVSRIQAALVAQALYPPSGRERILVVLFDDEYLHLQGQSWPVSYQDHADLIERLAMDPERKPASIFWDVTFAQARRDPTLPALGQAACDASLGQGVPVFLAALAGRNGLSQREELEALNRAKGGRCFTNVVVDVRADPLDGIAWTYPVERALALAAGAPPVRHPSAAVAVYEKTAGRALADRDTPIAIDWGLVHPAGAGFPVAQAYCEAGAYDAKRYMPAVLRWLLSTLGLIDAPRPICPYHETVSAARVIDMDPDALADLVRGRHVMVGGFVNGYNDFVVSPIHGHIPGVYYHAMALDNLLVHGDGYKRHADWGAPTRALAWAALVTAALIFAVHVKVMPRARRWLALDAKERAADAAPCGASGLGQRLRYGLWSALFWAGKLVLQLLVALALLSAFYVFFEIGLVALTELVGMVLVVEGVGLMALIRWFFLGPAREANSPPR